MRHSKTIIALFIVFTAIPPINAYPVEHDGIAIEVSEGWTFDTSRSNQIAVFSDYNNSATLDIIRYTIGAAGIIKSPEDIRKAIKGFYFELQGAYGGDSVTYTIKNGIVSFESTVNFYDSLNRCDSLKILKGFIARNQSGDQKFYLITASAPMDNEAATDIRDMIGSFVINEPLSDNLYPKSRMTFYLYVLLILSLTAFFYARNRRIQRSRHPLGLDSSSFWRCRHCGKVIHDDYTECSRCGNERLKTGRLNSN